MLNEHKEFVDYYAALEVSPTASQGMIEQAFRHLAKRYHPDHPLTADADRFNDIVTAHAVLKNRDKRAQYHRRYFANSNGSDENSKQQAPTPSNDVDDVRNDVSGQETILLYLYKKRRTNSKKPGAADTFLQRLIDCSLEELDFHIWYMKEKGLIQRTDAGLWAITVAGIDHVIAEHRREATELRFITAQVEA